MMLLLLTVDVVSWFTDVIAVVAAVTADGASDVAISVYMSVLCSGGDLVQSLEGTGSAR